TVTGTAARAAPGASSSAPASAKIDIVDFDFKPRQISVAPGGEITWHNTGQAPHTASFDDVKIDTSTLNPGDSASAHAPTKPGSYSYHCNIHPAKMRGVLVVVGQGTTDPTQTYAVKSAATSGGGPPSGLPMLALATGVIGAFLGGFGISAFARKKS